MSIALVGGLDRLKRQYEGAASVCGITLKVFTGKESCLGEKMGKPDKVILLTGMVSHNAREVVVRQASSMHTPVIFLNSNGVSALRQRLTAIAAEEKR